MRTKEQIKDFLLNVVVTENTLYKIMGFMIGKGLKEESEGIKYLGADNEVGEEWPLFWKWYVGDLDIDFEKNNCDKCPLCEMLNDLLHTIETETDPKKVQKASEQYQFLIEAFELDER